MSLCFEIIVFLALLAGKGIYLAEKLSGKGRNAVRLLEVLGEALPVGISFGKLCDYQTYLKTPVAQMNIAVNGAAAGTGKSFQGFADDSRAEMTDVQGLCNVGSAVVDNDLFLLVSLRNAAEFIAVNACRKGEHIFVAEGKVQESGLYGFRLGKDLLAAEDFRNLGNDGNGSLSVSLCSRKSTVALELAQVKTVRGSNNARSLGIAAFNECSGNDICKSLGNSLHLYIHPLYKSYIA